MTLGVLAASLAGAVALGRSSEATVAVRTAPLPVSTGAPDVPMPTADPLVEPVGEDWAADAAIRAALVEQQRDVSAARAAARRAARAYVAPSATATPQAATWGALGAAGVWVVGDSIAAGMSAAWAGVHETLAVPGARSTTVVPQVLAALSHASGRPVLVVALGANDDPRTPAVFRSEVRRLLAAAPGCVVWSTVHRPGDRWAPLNEVLRDEAGTAGGRLQLAEWDRMAAADPSLLQPDGIHPRTGTVYRSIAGLAQQAAQRCS